MPLEAGHAAHQAYAAVRLCDLWWSGEDFYKGSPFAADVQSIARNRAVQIFRQERADAMFGVLQSGEDKERSIMLAALEIFSSSGYYEDPNDRRRTVANIEEALIAYVSRYPLGQTLACVIPDDRYASGYFVGVEIPVDMYLEIETDDPVEYPFTAVFHDGETFIERTQGRIYRYRFTGRVDGVHFTSSQLLHVAVEENKTAARLDDAWRNAFITSHQPTGYCFAIGALLNVAVEHAVIRGMSIPLPKTFDYGGIVNEPIIRNTDNFIRWAKWVVHTCEVTRPYLDTPHDAPMYTHSCNRFFRPCPMIPFCDSPTDEREAMLAEMDVKEWSPLEEGNA